MLAVDLKRLRLRGVDRTPRLTRARRLLAWGIVMNEPQSSFRSPPSTFAQVLHADGPDLDLEAKLALYAWIVGRWDMEVTALTEHGKTHMGRGEIHAGWVLRGRAIQDVWMIRASKNESLAWRSCQGPATGMAQRCASTIQISTPGAFCGAIPQHIFSRSRLRELGMAASCRKDQIREAASCVGHFSRSNQTPFAGWPNAPQMKRIGARKWISGPAEPQRPQHLPRRQRQPRYPRPKLRAQSLRHK